MHTEAPTTTTPPAEKADELPISAAHLLQDARDYSSQAQTLVMQARHCAKDTKFLAEKYLNAAKALNALAAGCARRAESLKKATPKKAA